jgi:CheY-like chemotaxis protein
LPRQVPSRPRVLVVESNTTVRLQLVNALDNLGFGTAAQYDTCDEAIQALDRGSSLPVVLGCWLPKTAESISHRFGVVVTYGMPLLDTALKSAGAESQNGPFCFIPKPLRPDDLKFVLSISLAR